jgi:hypothetical protein
MATKKRKSPAKKKSSRAGKKRVSAAKRGSSRAAGRKTASKSAARRRKATASRSQAKSRKAASARRSSPVARVKRVTREVVQQAGVAVSAGMETLRDLGENLVDRVRSNGSE